MPEHADWDTLRLMTAGELAALVTLARGAVEARAPGWEAAAALLPRQGGNVRPGADNVKMDTAA